MSEKICTLDTLIESIGLERAQGKKIVHCHGVFDLLHPGHLRHFQEAKELGDVLVVSLTPDHLVNKGPGRPVFNEKLRLEQIAALGLVDYVLLNQSPDATPLLEKLRPDIYVKGPDYKKKESDVTGKIFEEEEAVRLGGGKIHFTQDITFSSSTLLNQHFDSDAQRIRPFMEQFKKQYTLSDVLAAIDSLSTMHVCVVGDGILDTYHYVDPLGQSGKGQQMVAVLKEEETFLGGAFVIANHLASFCSSVDLITGIGEQCPHKEFIQAGLFPNVTPHFYVFEGEPTLIKKRYIQKDGIAIHKLFETYSTNHQKLSKEMTDAVISQLKSGPQKDLLLVADFGNGFTNPLLISQLCQEEAFLAVNTQVNSGNRGFHVITNYHNVDFVSLNEPELRLASHDRISPLRTLAEDTCRVLGISHLSVTRGVNGVKLFDQNQSSVEVPALSLNAIDRVGAGDSYFALASLLLAKGYAPLLAGFVGSIAAAIDIQIIGNKESVKKVELQKYMTRLMK